MDKIYCIAVAFFFWVFHCHCSEETSIHYNIDKDCEYARAFSAHMVGNSCKGHYVDDSDDSLSLYQWCNDEIKDLLHHARCKLLDRKFKSYGFCMQHVSFIESYLDLTCLTIARCSRAYEYNLRACHQMVRLIDKLHSSIFDYPQYRAICAYLENFMIKHVRSDDARAQCLYAEFVEKIRFRGFDSNFTYEQLINHIIARHRNAECFKLMHLYGTRIWHKVANEGNKTVRALLKEYETRSSNRMS